MQTRPKHLQCASRDAQTMPMMPNTAPSPRETDRFAPNLRNRRYINRIFAISSMNSCPKRFTCKRNRQNSLKRRRTVHSRPLPFSRQKHLRELTITSTGAPTCACSCVLQSASSSKTCGGMLDHLMIKW